MIDLTYTIAIFERFEDGSSSDALVTDEVNSHADVGQTVEDFMRDRSKRGAVYEVTIEVSP